MQREPLLDELITDAAGVGDALAGATELRLEALRYAADGVVVANVPCAAQGREGPTMPDEDWSRLGGKFWKYEDRADRVKRLDSVGNFINDDYQEMK